jgi:hypothetical protein
MYSTVYEIRMPGSTQTLAKERTPAISGKPATAGTQATARMKARA